MARKSKPKPEPYNDAPVRGEIFSNTVRITDADRRLADKYILPDGSPPPPPRLFRKDYFAPVTITPARVDWERQYSSLMKDLKKYE